MVYFNPSVSLSPSNGWFTSILLLCSLSGAFGYFEVTHDISKYCKAKLFDTIGKKTPVAVRFSTVGECVYVCVYICVCVCVCVCMCVIVSVCLAGFACTSCLPTNLYFLFDLFLLPV